MSDHYDKPETVKSRQSIYARFAKLQAIREESRRIKEEPQVISDSHIYYDQFKSDTERSKFIEEDFKYTVQYKKEYEISEGGPDDDRINQKDEDENSQGDDTSVKAVSSNESNFMMRLNSLRGRVGRPLKTNSVSRSKPSQNTEQPTPPTAPSSYNEFECISTIMPPTELHSDNYNSSITSDELRKLYFSNYKRNTSLPIHEMRSNVVQAISAFNIVIIEGVTGCGKTTQVPVYLLEDAILDRPSVKAPVIYVTQPRRIAARSIAERVCAEHNWDVGSLVGYQVSLEKKVSAHTVLVFCTAGVLLQKIIKEKSLKNYTHIIIDEAHERDADTDLLMMMIRKLMLHEQPKSFRLVIMSATMDSGKLKSYFKFPNKSGHKGGYEPLYIAIGQQKTPCPIQVIYLEKLRSLLNVQSLDENIEFDLDNAELNESCLKVAVEVIVDKIPLIDNYSESSKSTLVFLPGLAEILRLQRMLSSYPGSVDCLDIIPLHSCLTVNDQLRVFRESRPGCRKVILATNIAESSITVPDVGFIIDFCLTKTLMKDSVSKIPTLKLVWSTQDKAIQRAGRTGRCCPGKVFRLVKTDFFRKLDEYAQPELLVAPLELSVLRVKNFDMGPIIALFAVVLDPPPFSEIRTAVLELKQIGALSATYQGKLSSIDGDVTELGKVLTALPIDVHLSKLIVLASVFDVVDDAIIVAACLSTNRTVVRFAYDRVVDNYEIKLSWAKGSQSDLFVCLDIYKEFKEYKQDKGKATYWLNNWCKKHELDERKLHDVDALVDEIKTRLQEVNIFTGIERPNLERNTNMDNLMLKIAFCAAFYPNFFLSESRDVDSILKELGGLDPTKTVVMSNMPTNQVPLYKTQIAKTLSDNICQDFDYIADISRAYIVLNDDDELCLDGMHQLEDVLEKDRYDVIEKSRLISKSVYKAVKLGDTSDMKVREYKELAAHERMSWYVEQRERVRQQAGQNYRLIPSRLKIVDEQPDNSRLLESETDEYKRIDDKEHYVEVMFNHNQARLDEHELFELERYESENQQHLVDRRVAAHETYKSVYKRIRGPESLIRMSFRSVLHKSKSFGVDVDFQSVNSVLLDSEFQKDRRQMLVSATVTQHSKTSKVTARDTTLMPNIRGLPTLMALLFAQYYRLIYNNQMDCIAGAVFGIGWDDEDKPLDEMYEVRLGFDVHITFDDLALINKARKMISDLLKFNEIQNAGKPQALLQCNLRDILLALIRKRRYPLTELDMSMIYYSNCEEAELFTKDVHNLPSDILADGVRRPFLPLAKFTKEYSEKRMYERIRENLNTLKSIGDGDESIPNGGIRCLLCGNGQKNCYILSSNIMKHLDDDEHTRRLEVFEFFESRPIVE